MVMQCITVHVSQTHTRYELLDGRKYLVARVVPIVEGVLNNYLVPAEEIAACIDAWNDLPLPLGHPQNDYGEYVSGKSPEMIAQSVGRFFNAQMDGHKLVGEVWLDIEKCQRLGGDAAECLRRIEANEIIEVSTAFYPTTTMQQGIWDGVRYNGIHRHLRPNHLALLPNGTGACNATMGCGIRAAQADHGCICVGTCTCDEGEDPMDPEIEVKNPGRLRQALRTLLAFANGADAEEPLPPTEEPHDGEEDGQEDEDKKAPVLNAEAAAEGSITQEPPPLPSVTFQEKGQSPMLTKQELVGRLLAHAHSSWKEEKIPVLMALEERVLEQLLQELDERQQEAPLTLKALQTELDTRDTALKAEYDQKLATHVQRLEEQQERAQLAAYFEQRGWKPEETDTLPLAALRRMHQELDPVSYLGNGMPRLHAQAVSDNLPDDDPKYD